MSSEIHKYIETAIENRENSLNAKVINFPSDLNIDKDKIIQTKDYNSWRLYDKSNKAEDGDQLKAVIGICFMFTSLVVMGLYSLI